MFEIELQRLCEHEAQKELKRQFLNLEFFPNSRSRLLIKSLKEAGGLEAFRVISQRFAELRGEGGEGKDEVWLRYDRSLAQNYFEAWQNWGVIERVEAANYFKKLLKKRNLPWSLACLTSAVAEISKEKVTNNDVQKLAREIVSSGGLKVIPSESLHTLLKGVFDTSAWEIVRSSLNTFGYKLRGTGLRCFVNVTKHPSPVQAEISMSYEEDGQFKEVSPSHVTFRKGGAVVLDFFEEGELDSSLRSIRYFLSTTSEMILKCGNRHEN